MLQVAGVLFAGFGHRRAASVTRCADGAESQVSAFDCRPEKAGLDIVFVDPDGLRLIRFQLADGGVQVLVPAADLDFVLPVDIADGGFFFGS